MRLPVESLYRGLAVRSAFLIILTLLSCLVAGPALAEKRVALVIGMSDYRQVPRLPNPTRDADVMEALFRKAGFDLVESKRDLGIAGLRGALREFAAAAQDADIAVVYYAGHGMEVDGVNYLIPVDARLASDFDIEDETVSLDRVLQALSAVKRLKLVILDACRDNPFANTMKRSMASRSIGRGLAKIEPASSDTLIAFAAKAGAVASDGDGQNGPFATALVKHITEPGLDLRIAFGRVRDDVLKATNNRQEPFVYGSLGGDTMALVPAVAKPATSDSEARVDYELAAQVGTKDAWDVFLAKYPAGFLADLAREQNAKVAAAQQGRDKADQAQREAEALAAQKTADFRKQLEEQSARQTAEARKKLSEEAKRELEEARQQIADQAKKELDDAKQQLAVAQQQAAAARQQVEQVKADAAADAKRQVEQAQREASQQPSKVAALTPTEPPAPAPAPAPQLDPADIARLLQAHLKRVGCYGGSADGNWDETSQKALGLFNDNARTKFDVKVASLDALDAVRGKADRVCPLACPKGQRVDGDHCVRIGCSSGFFLNSSGACEKRAEPAPRPKAVMRQEPTHSAPARGGASGKCFAFNGKQYCE